MQLGELAGVHPQTVARIERGECAPHEATVRMLAVALDVYVEALRSGGG